MRNSSPQQYIVSDDHRKNAINLIPALFYQHKKIFLRTSEAAIKGWADKCGALKRLDHDIQYITKYAIQNAIKNGYKPFSLQK